MTFYVVNVHRNIDQTCITRSAEFWNRWIRFSCYYNGVYSSCHWI